MKDNNSTKDLEFERERQVKKPIIPYSSIQIYSSIRDYMKAVKFLLQVQDSRAEYYTEQIRKIFATAKGQPADMMVTVSVRTAWSVFLKVLNLPKGSEVLMTSINIPDMAKIVKELGLVPVPVDINEETTAPSIEDLKRVTTPKARLLMVSYLYGISYPLDKIAAFCRERGILIIEDAAEAFLGNDYCGSQFAVMSLFSFGNIKRYTAFGGAISFLRDPAIFRKMNEINNGYPHLSKRMYLKKIFMAVLMGLILNSQFTNLKFKQVCLYFKIDYKEFVVKNLRGFKPKENYLKKFELRPPAALLALLHYRLSRFDNRTFSATNAKLLRAVQNLEAQGVKVPGGMVQNRSFWLFPVLVPHLKLCTEILNRRGVDAYLGATQLRKVLPTEGSSHPFPKKMDAFFDKILYMPISEIVPEKVIQTIVDEIARVSHIVEKHLAKSEPEPKL